MSSIHIDTGADWRGGQSQVLMLAEGLMQRGHTAVLAARRNGALAGRASEIRVPTVELPFRFEADPGSALSLARLAGRQEGPVLYHAHTPHALGIAILARQLGRPVPIVFTRRVVFPLKKFFVTRWKINRADRIVAVSRAVADELAKGGIAEDKIRVIHSAIDTRLFKYQRGPNVNQPLNILLSGALERAKGLDSAVSFIESASAEPLLFHFVGGGPDLQRIRQWAGGRKNVVVHGFVRKIETLMQDMFALMSFSPSEGFPNVVLQAMATGLPVLVFENDAVREILTREELGRIFRTEKEAMAILREWMSNKEALLARAPETSRWASLHYSQDTMVEQTLALYKEMIP